MDPVVILGADVVSVGPGQEQRIPVRVRNQGRRVESYHVDVVGVAVHSHFDLPKDQMTARVLRALENPNADVLFHPTCRRLGRRAPIDLDLDRVYEKARETGVALEVDAERLPRHTR